MIAAELGAVPDTVGVWRRRLLCPTLGEAVELETDLGAGLHPALVDPNQVENALVNLAVNARDAMPGDGSIRIETENAVISMDRDHRDPDVAAGPYALISGTDTGTGMPAEVFERALDPFFSTKATGKGSGGEAQLETHVVKKPFRIAEMVRELRAMLGG